MQIKYRTWADIAFKDFSTSKPTFFIVGSREISRLRAKELIKKYLSLGDLVIGLLEEEYIPQFENQPQFKSNKLDIWKPILDELEKKEIDRKIQIIKYPYKDLKYIIEKLKPTLSIFINSSWSRMFHLNDFFYTLHKHSLKYELISPFTSEKEAIEYELKTKTEINKLYDLDKYIQKTLTNEQILDLLNRSSKHSFDHTYQIGSLLLKNNKLQLYSWNKVVPFETYAMNYGSLREKNFSFNNDLNNYDTLHAEMDLLTQANKINVSLSDCDLYVSLEPCPTCAKALSQIKFHSINYSLTHSESYASKLFKEVKIKINKLD